MKIVDDHGNRICPYRIEKLADIETKPGCWHYTKVGIFDETNQVGEFTYNYHNIPPFYPFYDKTRQKWFALYSENYMYTSVMSLPDGIKVWSEKCEYQNHFCPVEYYVPILCVQEILKSDPFPEQPDYSKWVKQKIHNRFNPFKMKYYTYEYPKKGTLEEQEYELVKEKWNEKYHAWMKRNPFEDRYAPFGFVAGCVWGDDTSWKIEFLDLTDPFNVKRDDRFGYIELPYKISLEKAIDVDCIDRIYEGGKIEDMAGLRITTSKFYTFKRK